MSTHSDDFSIPTLESMDDVTVSTLGSMMKSIASQSTDGMSIKRKKRSKERHEPRHEQKREQKREKKREQKHEEKQKNLCNLIAPLPLPFALLLLAIIEMVRFHVKSPIFHLGPALRGRNINITLGEQLYLPSSLTPDDRRKLSIDLGNGECKYQPPSEEVPEDIDFHKTIIAGFPSGDKRMIFIQMEALTGWPAKDEWDFEYLGMSNHPFIKANYPHHEGIWGWGNVADQVVLMVRNIRKSMVEYHDILWDIGYATTWDEASLNIDNLYKTAPPVEDFNAWRDVRVMEECHWYGWFIDYWLEGGLMRDIFSHKITTPEHWYMLMIPGGYSREELDYDLVVGPDTVVSPSYDPHCTNGDVSGGCEPVAVISAEKLRDYNEGKAETAKIAEVLHNDDRTGKYVINQQAWDCIWTELIPRGKGAKTVYQRPGHFETDYNFSAEMLEEMIHELDRLITKYGGSDWSGNANAIRMVELLVWHRGLIQTELNEVNAGVRQLNEWDFLGPKERERRRQLKIKEGKSDTKSGDTKEKKDYSKFFKDLEEKAQRYKFAERGKRRLARKMQAEGKEG